MNASTTREEIVAAADDLFYRQGFEHTSFQDIAEAVAISRGNFYYHFKTKDEILDAVIERRLAGTRAMLERWELAGADPIARIRRFVEILLVNRAKIKRHGCPVGTLCTELAKLAHPSQAGANALFTLFRTWLRRQFVLLGRKADADELALHILARSQGVAVLANAFRDEKFLRHEVRLMSEWLAGVAAGADPHKES
ncbi:MAG TPA: TetR/AcrR family transcriptional regulator [Vitreimonas sp.]|uniref:TetR/AcrR family transcriptional regulator n=1 Tax=Vitreimonas sp. TaxID=3069702 RepID=UPI002D613167|nr:TetR/AcrR family transcriptional regulator [Vitreimonas sp.]HYD86090.1 TetR/AcrR family transcriptional regulator [Vitreimonas sp.]